jgi:nucleoside-diphosphate-sugar epimerase
VPVNHHFLKPAGRRWQASSPSALPARFRRPRLLIVGCGDVGERVLRLLKGRMSVTALTSSPERMAHLRSLGARPMVGNLDAPASLRRLRGLSPHVLHLAPPPGLGERDTRTQHLLQVLRQGSVNRWNGRIDPGLQTLVYGSTTGVYGNCSGEWVPEHRALKPQSARAQRRVDAESRIRGLVPTKPQRLSAKQQARAMILRIPGIYAPNRIGGTPFERLQKALPVLQAEQDVYTNHIHADDLARACLAALWRGKPQRAYNVCDDSVLKMGDYMDAAAQIYGLPRPPRVSWDEAQAQLSPMSLSFLRESRRIDNRRMKQELRLQLRWPDVLDGLRGVNVRCGLVGP